MADESRPVTGYPAAAPYSYPYAAPPPQSSAYYYAPQPDPRASLLRRLTAALIAAFIIAGTIVFISWIILRPRVPEFQADSLSLSSFNLTPSPNSLLTATWILHLTVRNPNHKVSLSYDQIESSIYYKSKMLSVTSLPPFTQSKRNVTSAEARFAATDAYVEGRAADGIGKEKREKGSVEFNTRVFARVRYSVGGWRARARFLRVYCSNLQVAFSGNSSNGLMSGGPRKCKVSL